MKISYIANVRLPTEKAHGLQIMKTCEAFAALGHTVTLSVPKRSNALREDPFTYYGVRRNFEIRYLWCLDTVHLGPIGFLLQYASFSFAAARAKLWQGADLVYGRDELTLACIVRSSRAPVVWESHVGSWNVVARHLVQRVVRIVTISKGLKDFYEQKGIAAQKIVVAPDGVDLAEFDHPEERSAARKRLGLPIDATIAMYIGRLDGYKGVDTLCDAASLVSDGTIVAIIGGDEPGQVERMSRNYPNVRFLGYRPYRELADNQAAADVLVIPNSAKSEVSSRFTSPLKLFTALVSRRPIVVSDLPSMREVLDEGSAFFFKPDDPRSLAEAIMEAISDPERAAARVRAAGEKARAFSWEARARSILAGVQS
jgi:glycosyltransferase involved in cell wall biosynthesis